MDSLVGMVSSKELHLTPPDFSGLDPDTGEPWSPAKVVELKGMAVQESSEVQTLCEQILADHPKEAEAYRNGKTKVLGRLIKVTLDASGGNANPRDASTILKELLGS